MSYSNINRVVLVGRLTSDPELRALPSGSTVCNLRLACNGSRKGPEGEYTEKPNFFSVSAFGALGESVHRYMSRGRRIAIDGRLNWSEWEAPEGGKRQAVQIVAETVQFLDGRGEVGHLWRVLKPGDGGPWMSSRRVLTPVLGCSRSEPPGRPDCASVMKQSAWVSIQVRAVRLVW